MDKSILNSRVSCKNIIAAVALLFIMVMPKAQAIVETPATLNGIEVKPLNGSYEITIDADKAVPVKTNSTDRNSLSIDLKNITPSKSVNTVYNNAGNIDHILIQPMGQDVRVTVQGMNAGAASVLLDSPKIPTSMLQTTPQTEITLNRSIDSYTPITPDEDALDLGNIFSLTAVDFHNLLTPSGLGWLVGLGIIFMVLLRSLINTEKEAKQYSEFSPKDILRQKEALRKSGEIDLKEEITKAQSRFNDSMLRKQGIQEQNASVKNYGIKEYQNSQVNPYKKVSKTPNVSIPVKNTEETTPKLNKLQEAVRAINEKANPTQQTPEKAVAATKTKVTKRDLSKAQTRLNNMKFLENMTRIYEKSGRVDLAQNIKETMKKRST